MADTFDGLWRRLRAYHPGLPPELAQRFVVRAFRDVLRYPHLWSWGLEQSEWTFPAVYNDGTITLTKDSATVTGSGTTWTADMVGRQLKVDNQVYTIVTHTNGTSIDIDRNWTKTTEANLSYEILQAYVTVPSDFRNIRSVVDIDNNWRLRTTGDRQWLDSVDAERSASGTPAIIVDFKPDANGVPQFEVWPHVDYETSFPYLYYKYLADVDSLASLPFHLLGDVLEEGALYYLSRWPGTKEEPNPGYSPKNWTDHRAEFERLLQSTAREDNEVFANTIWEDSWDLPYAPLDSKFIQSHAITWSYM